MPVNLEGLFKSDAEIRDIHERRNALRLTLSVAIPVALLFSCINYVEYHQWLATVQFAVTILLLLPAMMIACCKRHLVVGEYLLMVSAVLMFGALFFDGGIFNTGLDWLYIYPFVAFYIMGQNRGWLWVVMFGIALAIISGLYAAGEVELIYPVERLKYFFVAFFFYALIASIFNRLRNTFENKLMVLVQERTNSAEEYLEEIKHSMLHSTLTGLPNRVLLLDRLQSSLRIARRNHTSVAIAVVQIDRFTEINNVLSHKAGDVVLKHVALALEAVVRDMDTVAHIGANEFAVVMPTIGSDQIDLTMARILNVFREPVEVMSTTLEISGRVGFSLFPEHGVDANELLQHADVAMRMAKKEQMPFKLYDASDDPFNLRRLEMYRDLKRALANDVLQLYYQPQIDLKSGRVVGAEALMRWIHPIEGFVSPAEFIPMAEQTGLITELSQWALQRAIMQCARWQSLGNSVGVSVNLTPRCLSNRDVVQRVSELLSEYGLDAHSLMVEVTESLFMDHSDQVIAIMTELREMGVSISIDDFGTGYSSLSYLKNLPVDELKIDQAFIFPVTESKQDQLIVHSIVELAMGFGFEVIAEGVENIETGQMVDSLGVNRVQGYYYARPMPYHEFCRWMKAAELNGIEGTQSEKK